MYSYPLPEDAKTVNYKLFFVLLVLVGFQLCWASMVCIFLWDITLFTNITPVLLWIIACDVILFIVAFLSFPSNIDRKFRKILAIAFVVAATASLILLYLSMLGTFGVKMLQHITHYSSDSHKKRLLDRMQIIFQCCGAINITDWFYTDWQNAQVEPLRNINLEITGWDAVPFSCCSVLTACPCHNRALVTFGLNSLYTRPCSPVLTHVVVCFLFAMALLSIAIAVILFPLLSRVDDENSVCAEGRCINIESAGNVSKVVPFDKSQPTFVIAKLNEDEEEEEESSEDFNEIVVSPSTSHNSPKDKKFRVSGSASDPVMPNPSNSSPQKIETIYHRPGGPKSQSKN